MVSTRPVTTSTMLPTPAIALEPNSALVTKATSVWRRSSSCCESMGSAPETRKAFTVSIPRSTASTRVSHSLRMPVTTSVTIPPKTATPASSAIHVASARGTWRRSIQRTKGLAAEAMIRASSTGMTTTLSCSEAKTIAIATSRTMSNWPQRVASRPSESVHNGPGDPDILALSLAVRLAVGAAGRFRHSAFRHAVFRHSPIRPRYPGRAVVGAGWHRTSPSKRRASTPERAAVADSGRGHGHGHGRHRSVRDTTVRCSGTGVSLTDGWTAAHG